jgi:hypothetical protein
MLPQNQDAKNAQDLVVYEECSKSSLNKSALDKDGEALCQALCADSDFAALTGCADYV